MNSAFWNPISSQADIESLLKLFGWFHDGCLREAHVWTEHSVNSDLRMSCTGDLDTRVRILIQRQFKEPSAIELLFQKVTTFHLKPSPENYDSIIFGATMLYQDDTFYWADAENWLPNKPESDETTWIAAKKVFWRDASNWMGAKLRFVEDSTEPKI
jgi:hypothetical protein